MIHTLLGVAYFSILLGLSAYGLHRLHLVVLCWRHRKAIKSAQVCPAIVEDDLPFVTIQLPLFNESTVATRLLEATAQMDYPRDRFEIQVLDDSTDETQALARTHVEKLKARGVDCVYIHRTD